MKNFLKSILLLSTLGFLVLTLNCATPGIGPNGILFTSTQVGSYGTGKAQSKIGEACASSILGLIATGDASVEAAKQNGGINNITSINYKTFSILGLYAKLCTEVKGN